LDLITSNPLLTFNDSLNDNTLKLIRKIESTAQKTAKDFFNFFIGIFVFKNKDLAINKLRLNFRFEPFVFAKDLEPFKLQTTKRWFLPEKSKIKSMPSLKLFKQKKLIMKYFSTVPKAIYDEKELVFFNDLAGVFTKKDDVLLEFAEIYFNSNLIKFYYKNKFPHNNKFLKKNFNKLPFFKPSINIQKIIVEDVRKLKENEKNQEKFNKIKKNLNKYIYQLFKLSKEEIDIIEKNISS
jgi:hypothetical protein